MECRVHVHRSWTHTMRRLNHIHQQEIPIFSWPLLSKSLLILLAFHHFPDIPPLTTYSPSYSTFLNPCLSLQAWLTTVLTNELPMPVLIYAICLTYANTTFLHLPISSEKQCLLKMDTMQSLHLLTLQAVLPRKQDAKVDVINTETTGGTEVVLLNCVWACCAEVAQQKSSDLYLRWGTGGWMMIYER